MGCSREAVDSPEHIILYLVKCVVSNRKQHRGGDGSWAQGQYDAHKKRATYCTLYFGYEGGSKFCPKPIKRPKVGKIKLPRWSGFVAIAIAASIQNCNCNTAQKSASRSTRIPRTIRKHNAQHDVRCFHVTHTVSRENDSP